VEGVHVGDHHVLDGGELEVNILDVELGSLMVSGHLVQSNRGASSSPALCDAFCSSVLKEMKNSLTRANSSSKTT